MEQQAEPTQIITRSINYFKQNKQTVFFVGGAIVLLLIIFSLVMISSKNKVNTTAVPKVTPSVTNEPSQKTALPTPSQNSISPQKRQAIVSQTKPQLDKVITIDYTIPTIRAYGDTWAIMVVNNPTTDPANVVVEKINGTWRVMLGPGTHFDEQSLRAIGAPQSLIDEANASL